MDRFSGILDKTTAALVITDVNRRYLTGFQSSLGYLFVTAHEAKLLVDGRYYLAAGQSVKSAQVVLIENVSVQLNDWIKSNGIKTLLLEKGITVSEFECFKAMFEDIEVVADGRVDEKLADLRSVKTVDEIASIIAAQRIAERAFSEVLNFIKVGVTEHRIATELEYRMRLFGSEDKSFDTIVVSGFKSAMPHGVPDGKFIERGDFITMDFGAVVNGYHSDMTRTVAVSCVSDEMAEVYDTVLRAQSAAESMVKNGAPCVDIDKAARNVIASAGYGEYFTHSTGHSLGLEVHESPNLSLKSTAVLKKGQVVTNEPGIYIDGKFGVRVEDMLLVTDNGCENLTKCEKSLIIL